MPTLQAHSGVLNASHLCASVGAWEVPEVGGRSPGGTVFRLISCSSSHRDDCASCGLWGSNLQRGSRADSKGRSQNLRGGPVLRAKTLGSRAGQLPQPGEVHLKRGPPSAACTHRIGRVKPHAAEQHQPPEERPAAAHRAPPQRARGQPTPRRWSQDERVCGRDEERRDEGARPKSESECAADTEDIHRAKRRRDRERHQESDPIDAHSYTVSCLPVGERSSPSPSFARVRNSAAVPLRPDRGSHRRRFDHVRIF